MLNKDIQDDLIAKGRAFLRGYRENDPYADVFESDQDLKLPQPPLVKAAKTADASIGLTRDFTQLPMLHNLTQLLESRHSARIYTQENMNLTQLAFLLWACQGVKSVRGKSYATLRTVPSGGARHPFETYLVIRKIEGLKPGIYHYLPMDHALEYLHSIDNMETVITQSLCDQSWAAKANVLFYWTVVPYRAEWRYGIHAHRTALMDAGHMAENLYLACTGIGLGTCAIASFSDEICNQMLGVDGEEEYMVYAMPVGTVRDSDKAAEQSFYKFVEEENL